MEGGEEKGKRRIKLFCPSACKILQVIARDEQKLDLGSIARAFGLNPNTLKLNGHFISRGVDLVASSVTWKSLIGFFSARGLSTGATDSNALVVDGRLSKVGSKRSHELEDAGNGILDLSRKDPFGVNKRPQHEHCSLLNNERVKDRNSGQAYSMTQTTRSNGFSLKRKWYLADESHVKRTKSDEDVSDKKQKKKKNMGYPGCQERRHNALDSILSCSKTMKRMRGSDDEMVATAPLKKNRIVEPP